MGDGQGGGGMGEKGGSKQKESHREVLVSGADHVDGDLEARVAIAGQDLRNIAEYASLRPTPLGHTAPAQDRDRDRLRPTTCA